MELIRIAGTVNDSIVDGPGLRYTVFTQGCPHGCPGCHNPQSHDFEGGKLVEISRIVKELAKNPLLDGITLSGGEPFCQGLACAGIARAAHEMGLNVWAYTGYVWETLVRENKPDWNALIEQVDVLVDGPFLLQEKSLELKFRGSRNQRLINVPQTRSTGRVALWEPPVW